MTIAIDGNLTDWSSGDRLERAATTVNGYEMYGRFEGGQFIIALKSAIPVGANTTFWLNTDQNTATGHQIFDWAGGAEYNINIGADGVPRLYTGAAGQTPVADLTFALSPDGTILEIAVPKALVGNASRIDLLADVNDGVFLPGDYSATPYRLTDTPVQSSPASDGYKIAIVYSESTAANFFSDMAYSQLIMAAQSQAMAAGIPFEIISEADLTDIGKLSGYDAIVFPSFRNVPGNYEAIYSTLQQVVQDYRIPLVVAGEFMTNGADGASLPGNAYARMNELLGVTRVGGQDGAAVQVVAGPDASSIVAGYEGASEIRNYTSVSTNWFTPLNPSGADIVVNQIVNGTTYNGVIANTIGTPNIHFATEALFADSNLLGQALDWATTGAGSGPQVSLQMSRSTSIVASRNDMDQSQETYDVNGGIYDKLLPMLEQWKAQYGFVGSYYVNIGAYSPDQETNWTKSGGYYDQLLAMGNEIGSHSYTHPFDTNLLLPDVVTQEILDQRIAGYAAMLDSPFNCFCPYCARYDADPAIVEQLSQMTVTQINQTLAAALQAPNPATLDPVSKAILEASFRFQFETSRHVLEQNLGIPVTGVAVPGMPESLETARQIIQYYDYMSGGAALVGAGYPGAFGYLTPDLTDKVYIAPNMSFDFTLMGWLGLSQEEALQRWQDEWHALTINSDMPIVVWPWHDYGLTQWTVDPGVPSPYSVEMFQSFVETAYNSGAEFVTLADLAERIKAFDKTSLSFSVTGDQITATATPSYGHLGTFALDISSMGGKVIQSVSNWYAYDGDSVYLDADGGTYEISLGTAAADVTHITSLGQRAKLLSLTGNGTDLDFTIQGEGRVVIDLKAVPGYDYTTTGATVVSLVGDILTLDLGAIGTHTVSVKQNAPVNTAPTDITVTNLAAIAENTAARTKIADLAVVDADIMEAHRNNVLTVNDARFEIGTDGALYLKAGQTIDFEAAGTIALTLTATDGALSFSKSINVSVTDVNEAATDITVANLITLPEHTAARTKIADLAVIDPDVATAFRNNAVTVSDARFEIGTDGALYLKAGQTINFAAEPQISLTLTATDGALVFSKQIAVNVTDVNLPPSGGVQVTGSAVKNSTLTANVSTLSDPDGLGTLSYQWQRNSGSGFVDIAGATGAAYLLVQDDAGATMRVVVSYTDLGGTAEFVASSATSAVADTTAVNLPAVKEDMITRFTAAQLLGAAAATATITSLSVTHGSVLNNGDGSWYYLPVLNSNADAIFSYTATLSGGGTLMGSAKATITGMPDITGTAGANILTGTASAEHLHGLAGNDIIRAGGGNDIIFGDEGNDLLFGEAGDDRFIATPGDGNDVYDGGGGNDTYDLARTSAGANVNLALGISSSAETGADLLISIEHVAGSRGNDTIIGSAARNIIDGGYGNDVIRGGGGNDWIIGGAGNDTLYGDAGDDQIDGGSGIDVIYGGAGRDVMTGGLGGDFFTFVAASDTGKTAATRDIITDFTPGQDKIHLGMIDANPSLAGDQAFTFVAARETPFNGIKGQLVWLQRGADTADKADDRTVIKGDLNGDRVADFQIELTGLINLTQADFIL